MSSPGDTTRTPTDEEEAGIEPPRRPRSSLSSFLFIALVLFMFTNTHGDEPSARTRYVAALDALGWQLGNYSAWLNGTASNFSLPVDHPVTIPLVSNFMTFGSTLDPLKASYYTNITGFWHGDVRLHNLTSAANTSNGTEAWRPFADELLTGANETELGERGAEWNWDTTGTISISVGDKMLLFTRGTQNITDEIASIHGKVELYDRESEEELRLDFDGVHFIRNGTIYALVEPPGRHIDLRDIPSLVPTPHVNDTARAIEGELSARIARLREKIDSGTFDQESSSSDPSPNVRCSFKLFMQLAPSPIPADLMHLIEDEIAEPTGIAPGPAPPLRADGVLLSQDCGILYEIKDTSGLKSQSLYRKITTYAGLATIVYLIVLALHLRQTKRSGSAQGLARVSRYAFLTQSLIDAISFVGHITLAILADGRPSLTVLAPAGLACILFVSEAQFAVLIGQIQAPEDAAPATPRPPVVTPVAAPSAPGATPAPPTANTTPQATYPPAPAVAPASTANAAPALTQPVPAATPTITTTPPPGRPSFLVFLWQHIRTDPSARIWTLMSLFLIFVFRIVLLLSLPLFFVGSLYSMLWLPQIWRAARRVRTSGLGAEYVFGITACRLFFVLYFLGCPVNILDVEPRRWIYAVAIFMLLQAGTIMLQEHVSPSFFLPGGISRVQTYDYHPQLPPPDPESPDASLGDCSICMDAIHAEHRRARSSDQDRDKEREGLLGLTSSGLLQKVGVGRARRSYSMAPCGHLFHTACLERWLAIKNICPQCRRPLPPL
ncbi:hypothetical protein CERSUDRAFT_92794 [Gelatoporia subvermispora B]|uniref:RING-type E3 ubiquitin transferase n=1 Tax=Ceriporiopsis subvermispora (strain B) TaxID=914234 RepID=M2RJW2_CERS8|nr:hypothetical protein CERSUDRAFT_92794 [Gelatoporia subvermispora B]